MGEHIIENNIHSFVDETMRNLDNLLESSQDATDVNRRLDVYEQIAKLEHEKEQQRISNLRLQATQEGLIIQMERQRKIQADFEAREARLKHQIETQKSSMSSLFADLEIAKRRVEWLEAKLGNVDPAGDSASLPLAANRRGGSQADLLLASSISKNGSFFSSPPQHSSSRTDVSADQQRIRELEGENARLKSEFVRLQAEYKEERYLSRKTIEELMQENMTATTAPESTVSSNSSSLSGSSLAEDSDSSNEDPLRCGADCSHQRPSLDRARSLRRVKEFDEHLKSFSGMPGRSTSSVGSPMVRPLSRKTSLPARHHRTSSRNMVDVDDDGDRPYNMRPLGRVAAPRRTRSLWPGNGDTTPDDKLAPPQPTEEEPVVRMPRRVQSLHIPAPYQRQQQQQHQEEVNLHDVSNNTTEASSRSGLISRGLSLRRKNWWSGKGQ